MPSSILNFVRNGSILILLLIFPAKCVVTLNGTSLSKDSSGTQNSMVIYNTTDGVSNNSSSITSVDLDNDTNASALQKGWNPQPDGRGTIDIIWGSCTTIFLCCWTALCINVPPPQWSRWKWLFHKTLLFCLGVLGPEFVLGLALGQWVSAHRSVEEFKSSGHPQWSITHAFLVARCGRYT